MPYVNIICICVSVILMWRTAKFALEIVFYFFVPNHWPYSANLVFLHVHSARWVPWVPCRIPTALLAASRQASRWRICRCERRFGSGKPTTGVPFQTLPRHSYSLALSRGAFECLNSSTLFVFLLWVLLLTAKQWLRCCSRYRSCWRYSTYP